MKRLLIIGNGFDLYHQLRTKYKDFLQYIVDKYALEEDMIQYYVEEEMSFDGFGIDIFPSFDADYSSEMAYYMVSRLLIVEKNKYESDTGLKYKFSLNNNRNWCFIEDYFSEIELWDAIEGIKGHLQPDEDNPLHDFYNHEDQNEVLFFVCNFIYHELENWVYYVEQDIKGKQAIDVVSDFLADFDLILNFNYTSTLKSLYGVQNDFKIHVSQLGLVFGHFDRIRTEENIPQLYDEIEFLNKYRKDTETWVSVKLTPYMDSFMSIDEIYIFGHSVNGFDIKYYEFIFSLNISHIVKVYLNGYNIDEANEIKSRLEHYQKWNEIDFDIYNI